MRVTKSLAMIASGALLAAAALVAVAGPASASDEGTQMPGAIYWFGVAGPLASQTPATQITSGSNASTGGPLSNGRPWAPLTTENACPAGTVNMASYIRIPTAGAPENDWDQVQVGAVATLSDADGRFYTTTAIQADRLNKAQVVTYNTDHPGTNVFPFLTVCRDAAANSLGYFKTSITITGTTSATTTWSIVAPAYNPTAGQIADTTTTLSAVADGKNLKLTAAVTPSAAGTVTFKEGTTTLGTAAVDAGSASLMLLTPTPAAQIYTADFAPTDAAAFKASQGTKAVTVALDATSGNLTLDVPAAPVVDGALTFSAPFDTPVALAGARVQSNTRVTASAAFPTVTVTDTRRDGLLTSWEVNAQATDFTGSSKTIGAKYLGWDPKTPSMTPDVAGGPLVAQAGSAVMSFLDNASSGGLGAGALLGKAATPGRGVSVLNADLNLAIPADSSAGTYTSTVTVTLISN
jgi:hypothetical protein